MSNESLTSFQLGKLININCIDLNLKYNNIHHGLIVRLET